jgi:transcription elongation factor Elf1
MGRRRKKTIKRIRVKLPTRIFNCPRCYAVKVFAVRINKLEKIAKGSCPKCKGELVIPLRMTSRGTVATIFTAIDYYSQMVDSLTRKVKE